MRRNYLFYIQDILTSIDNIQSYVGQLSYQELINERMRLDAIIRNFEIIGEAASRIPHEIRGNNPSIEWRKISDFRNVLAHEYFGIDYEIMWEIIDKKLPDLKRSIQLILGEK
jgi:uncharacterized protein with HEPN domain